MWTPWGRECSLRAEQSSGTTEWFGDSGTCATGGKSFMTGVEVLGKIYINNKYSIFPLKYIKRLHLNALEKSCFHKDVGYCYLFSFSGKF